MVASVNSAMDLCNIALVKLGWRGKRIGFMFEGSQPSKAFLALYAQTRDAILRQSDWGFPRGDANLTLLKAAPSGGYGSAPGLKPWNPATNPPPPYLFEYEYPEDALLIRSVNPPVNFVPNFLPTAHPYEIANDATPLPDQENAPARVILCYVPSAVATYLRQVTDMTQWDVGFVELLTDELGRRVAPSLSGADQAQIEAQKVDIALAQEERAVAVSRQG
jgi:hypothetical protein